MTLVAHALYHSLDESDLVPLTHTHTHGLIANPPPINDEGREVYGARVAAQLPPGFAVRTVFDGGM